MNNTVPISSLPRLLVHGWGMNARVWQPLQSRWSRRVPVRAVDLPGHGQNRTAAGDRLEQWAEDAASGLASPAVWVGWSLGGLVALAAARHWPEKVAALVLVASTPRFTRAVDWPQAMEPALLRTFEAELKDDYHKVLMHFITLQSMGAPDARADVRQLKRQLKDGGEPAPGALRQGLAFLMHEDRRADLAGLECPCLLVLGRHDRLVPDGLAGGIRRDYPNIEVAVIDGGSHAPFLSHTDAFDRIVSDWLGKPES